MINLVNSNFIIYKFFFVGEVYLIAIDLFDSMLEYFELFESLKQKCVNTKFIFFHIPGNFFFINLLFT